MQKSYRYVGKVEAGVDDLECNIIVCRIAEFMLFGIGCSALMLWFIHKNTGFSRFASSLFSFLFLHPLVFVRSFTVLLLSCYHFNTQPSTMIIQLPYILS